MYRKPYPAYTIPFAARRKLHEARAVPRPKENPALNTLEESLNLARVLAAAIENHEGKAYRSYRIFSAFASDELEALAAFFIWSGRGRLLKEVFQK